MLVRSYVSKTNWSKSLMFQLFTVAVAIGTLGLNTIAASGAVPGPKMIVREFGNGLVLRTGEQKHTAKISFGDLKERGIKLRAELEKTFERLRNSDSLNRMTDVTTSVTPYISVGMTFEEAEAILRAAGFDVDYPDAREGQQHPNRREWYVVHAEIRNFSRRVLGSLTVAVTLYPESPGDYSNVKKIKATLLFDQS